MSTTSDRDLFGGRKGEFPIPAVGRLAQCASCNAAILWSRTEAGKAIPLSVATIEERDGVKYALSHFVDCPDGKGWSKKK